MFNPNTENETKDGAERFSCGSCNDERWCVGIVTVRGRDLIRAAVVSMRIICVFCLQFLVGNSFRRDADMFSKCVL